jgi:PIN domain nuclease of toxin-antitoxin system
MVACGKPLEATAYQLDRLQLDVIPFDVEQAKIAASLCSITRLAGLSPGDCACLALALSRKLPAYTADRAWEAIDAGAEIRLIR